MTTATPQLRKPKRTIEQLEQLVEQLTEENRELGQLIDQLQNRNTK